MDDACLMEGAQRAAGLFEKLLLVFFRYVGIEPVLQCAPAVLCHHIVRRQHQDLRHKKRRCATGDGHLRHFEIIFLLDGIFSKPFPPISHLPLDPVRLIIQREGNHAPVCCFCYRFLRRLFQPRIICNLTHTLPHLGHFYLYFTKGKTCKARFGRGDWELLAGDWKANTPRDTSPRIVISSEARNLFHWRSGGR